MAEWHLKVIFCLLTTAKFHFVKVEKTIFHVVARQSDLVFFLLTIFGLLTIPKCDLGDFEKAMFQSLE